MIRRDRSGIYIFDQFPGEEKMIPTCIEDCQEETRIKWLNTLDRGSLVSVVDCLCKTLNQI